MLDWEKKDDKEVAEFVTKTHTRLKDIRRKQDNLNQRVIRMFRPRRHDMLSGDKHGEQYGARIYTGRPAIALLKHCYGFIGYTVSKAIPWLAVEAVDQELMADDDVKTYCENFAAQVLSAAKRSNLHQALLPFTLDAQSVGYGVNDPDYDILEDHATFRTIHPRESFIADDWHGNADVYVRELKVTAKRIVERFERVNVPKEVLDTYEQHPFTEYELLYGCFRNGNSREDYLSNLDLPYMGVYVLRSKASPPDKFVLERRGKRWFPIIWRPGKDPDWAYGTSLSADSLTSALYANQLRKKMLRAAGEAVDRTMIAHSNLRNDWTRKSGGTIWSDNPLEETAKPLFDQVRWPIAAEELEAVLAEVDDRFSVRFFEMLSSGDYPQMTAYQVSRMMGEKAVLMSPLSENFEEEALRHHIEVLVDVEDDAGRLPEMPGILQDAGGILELQYLGPLPQLQRSLLKSKGTIDSLGLMEAVISMFPNSALKIREMELIEEVTVAQGMSQKLHRSDSEMAEIQAAMAESEARERQLQEAEVAANVASKASSEVHPNSPLALMGVGGNL
jgi:hypothetical protein